MKEIVQGGLIGSCGDSILMINNIKMNENLISAPLGAGGLVGAVGKTLSQLQIVWLRTVLYMD